MVCETRVHHIFLCNSVNLLKLLPCMEHCGNASSKRKGESECVTYDSSKLIFSFESEK